MSGVTALIGRWRCSEKGCPEKGEGTPKACDKAAERHGKTEGHATLSWAEPPLPIAVKR